MCDSETGSGDATGLYQFLSHPESIRCLSQSLNPFAPPSAKSKSEFESKTAAIHVNTSPQAPYDLSEIKADASWLSEKAKVDEVTALRITILEWQSRPAARLLAGFSEEESTSLQDAAGVDSFRASLAGLPMVQIVKRTADREDGRLGFSTEESRRHRLRLLYLSEKNHILKVSRKLLALSLSGRRPNQPIAAGEGGNARDVTTDAKLRELGLTIFKDKSGNTGKNNFLSECVAAIRSRLSDFEGEGGWLGAVESNQECEDAWRTMLIDEIVHIMQILFLQLQSSNSVPTAELVLSWLRLMGDYGFLESVRVVSTVCICALWI